MTTVRTRVAPSPTGDPHVGTAYIALFNLAFARQHGGQFILRIEDTDQTRSTDASEQKILDSLRWLGLEWDEGPDVGGPHGPYRQSERKENYAQYAMQLVEEGKAFLCYRTGEELDELRTARRAAGGHTALKQSDLALPEEEVAKRKAAGAPYVVRMCVPEDDGVCVVDDMLRGSIELEWGMVDAQILLKSDGMPTYHLANVVDDHLMEITHVIRGEEWINSAPKHKLLYQYFGWDMPQLCHMPLLRNPDKSKLSKRKNPTSILYYQRMGFLPEALLNYLARMGWSMPDESEKFSRQQMFDNFDIQRVSLGGPIFDQEKLSWLNGLWLREDLDPAQFAAKYQEWALNPEYLMQIVPLIQQRVEKLSDVAPLASFFLAGMLDISEADFEHKSLEKDDIRRMLQYSVWLLDIEDDWSKDRLFAQLKQLAEAMGFKIRDFLFPLFIAVAGINQTVSVMDSMAILGPDMTRARLRHAVNVLGGPSKKEAKRWEKEYRSLSSQIQG
ncbi:MULTISPECIES: glutamate--tRNA ligase [unclassified Neptuniibacter]|uniref:glutamate--tRNA ligase n=1 Tax=unclassified Neptuniibacter TaxID=2630693 RepID=UPI000C46501C|nr:MULTISPECIES: glutamate--tRNA ligase [unclassified Neptuniibacter]MAY42419.1 glutamate--tRNA ligase [Oceanospirillaceae bacterium]|tara:strand:- start:37264 stop:38766 length:1503 start_codon:yes stop_codon:yes gene_type:complete